MSEQAQVIISGFADEAAVSKTAVEQMAVFAAIGLQYYSIRFIDLGSGVKNVMHLSAKELRELKKIQADYGISVATLGSPIGKVKLLDVDDGTRNRYVPFKKYLREEVDRAIELAQSLGTRLIRGFSFYPPQHDDPWEHLDRACDQLAAIVERCEEAGLVYGLEVEANLVGRNGKLLAAIYRKIKSKHLALIFDGGNLAAQNLTPDEIFDEYVAMRPGIGWMHIKDYKVDPKLTWTGAIDEERLKNFVPVDSGDSGYERILRDFRNELTKVDRHMKRLGAPGVFLELEPHLKGGGQFGGFSGPDGMGVALRSLTKLLDYLGIGYHLRDFGDIRAARGF